MLPQDRTGVYLIRNTMTGAVYVGSSRKSIETRWERHRKALRGNRHDNQRLQRAWNKYGEAAFEFIIHEALDDADEVRTREQHWIEHYRAPDSERCYNLTRLAFGGGPLEWTPEMRARLSASRVGHAVSDKTREKLRQRFIGRPLSEEHRKKLSDAHKGYKPSRESIEKRAASNRGKSHARIVYDGFIAPDGQEHRNIRDLKRFAQHHGLSYSSLQKVATGRVLSHKGWKKVDADA